MKGPARKYPQPNPHRHPRKRVRRPAKPIMVTVQEVHCRACKRKFELLPDAPANFCIWCRSDNIQSISKTRRETPAERQQREFEMNGDFTRESPWFDQGHQLLKNEAGFKRWVRKFRPEVEADKPKADQFNRNFAFEVKPPISYPAMVVYVRVRRSGLSECEFYWDFVIPNDFLPRSRSAKPKLRSRKAR